MKITVAVLKKWGACNDGVEWFGSKSMTLEKLILKLQSEKRYNWIWWTMRHTLNKTQSVKVAIYAAESVIDIFEKEYPDDKRPREAIEAAKAWLKNPCEQTAADAADAADAAAESADAAVDAATWAAWAADAAVDEAAWAAADSTKADLIVHYYIKILKEVKK